jgi:hypothetical protein
MAQQERDRFVMQLKQTAAERKIPIDRLSSRDLPDKDGFELIIEAGGKKQIFTIDELAAIKDPQGEIDLLINQIGDNE